jgi:2-oxoglutarate ferredoxin oxidoreductase subunit delta
LYNLFKPGTGKKSAPQGIHMNLKVTPLEEKEEDKKRKASIIIDRDRCKGCYFCVKFCPKQLIAISNEHNKQGYFPAEFDAEKEGQCTGCKTCAIMCPDTAIEVLK